MPRPFAGKNSGGGAAFREKTGDARRGVTRREFVIGLGAGTTASIVGWFLLRGEMPAQGTSDAGVCESPKPNLRDDVIIGKDGEMVTVSRVESAGPTVCAMNRLGAEVVARLDGNHTIEDISEAVAGLINAADHRSLDAKIAHFVAQIGMLGFLAEPFYALIFENMEGRIVGE